MSSEPKGNSGGEINRAVHERGDDRQGVGENGRGHLASQEKLKRQVAKMGKSHRKVGWRKGRLGWTGLTKRINSRG